jgi:membrane protein required for colicin V production
MLIDIACVVFVVMAIIKGYSRGFIVAIFSVISFIVGLAAAMKLSAVVAAYLSEKTHLSNSWLPVLSFAIVFVGVVLLVRLGAGILEKTLQVAMLGWANRLAGIVLYIILYLIVLSILCFYASQIKLISTETLESSVCWSWIQPWGPWAMNGIGKLIPIFKDMFEQLKTFFDGISNRVAT